MEPVSKHNLFFHYCLFSLKLQEIPSNDQINAVKMHDNNLKFGMPMSTRSWLSKRIEKREPEGGSITLSMYGKTFKICK